MHQKAPALEHRKLLVRDREADAHTRPSEKWLNDCDAAVPAVAAMYNRSAVRPNCPLPDAELCVHVTLVWMFVILWEHKACFHFFSHSGTVEQLSRNTCACDCCRDTRLSVVRGHGFRCVVPIQHQDEP